MGFEMLAELLHESRVTEVALLAAAIAVALLLGLRLTLPPEDRKLIRAPSVLLALYVITVAISYLVPASMAQMTQVVAVVGWFVLLLSIGRSAFLLVVDVLISRRLTQPLPRIFRDIIQGVVYAAIALLALRAAGVEPGSLLTTSALLTAVIGLSLQDTLGNMFAGLAIQTQQPFEVGDWIQFDVSTENVGHVVEINWRATRLRTVEDLEVTVPNSLLARAAIRNFSKPSVVVRRQIRFFAPYEVPPRRAAEIALESIVGLEGVLVEPRPSVLTNDFTERGVEYSLRYYISDFARREPIRSTVQDRVWYALNRAAISMPVPMMSIKVDQAQARQDDARSREIGSRVKTLGAVDFLQVLPTEARQRIAERATTRLYAPEETIIREGEVGEELFVIERGEVRVLVSVGSPPRRVEVATLDAGRFFGEMSVMTGEPRSATVLANRETEVIVIGKDAVKEVFEASPELVEVVGKTLAERREALDESVARASHAIPRKSGERTTELLSSIKKFFKL